MHTKRKRTEVAITVTTIVELISQGPRCLPESEWLTAPEGITRPDGLGFGGGLQQAGEVLDSRQLRLSKASARYMVSVSQF